MIDKNDPRLTAFVLGELNEKESAEIQSALEQSAELQSAVQEIRLTIELLTQQFANEPSASLTAQQREEIFAATPSVNTKHEVKDHSSPSNVSTRRSMRPWLIGVIAAGLVTILGSLIYQTVEWSDLFIADHASTRDNETPNPSAPSPLTQPKKSSDANGLNAGAVAGLDIEETDSHPIAPKEEESAIRSGKGFPLMDGNFVFGSDGQITQAGESESAGENPPNTSGGIRLVEPAESSKSLPPMRPSIEDKFDGLLGGIDLKVGPDTGGEHGVGRGSGGGGFGGGGGGFGNSPARRGGGSFNPASKQNDDAFLVGDLIQPDPNQSAGRPITELPQQGNTNAATDELMTELLKKVDPSSAKNIRLKSLTSDHIEILVDGKEVQNIELGTALKALTSPLPDQDNSGGQGEKDVAFQLAQLEKSISDRLIERNRILAAKNMKSWKRVKATANTSRLMVGDKDELNMQGMQVNVQVDGFRARVLLDCFYYNDRDQQLEGNFKLRLPDDASLYYVAFGQSAYEYSPQGQLSDKEFIQPPSGQRFVSLQPDEIAGERGMAWESVKEARMVPRAKAALAYTQTVRRKVDPALVEWSGAGVFAARVFPLMPKKLHRIVIGYDVNLIKTPDGLKYRLDLPDELGQCKINVNVSGLAGSDLSITPSIKPQGDANEYLYNFSNSKLGDSRSIELNIETSGPVLLHSNDPEEGSLWTTQFTPELPKEDADANSRAVFLLDTSLSSNPDKFNVWLKLLRETLTQNRDSMKQFSVMMFNVESYFWKEAYSENTPENVDQLIADCENLVLEGATDLYTATRRLTSTPWISEKGSPDLFLLSDGAANWGETNLRLIRNQLTGDKIRSLYAYQTGLSGTAINSLRFLADQSGGAVFSVASEAELAQAATAHRSRPWQIKSIDIEGGTDIMTAGRVSWIYPGQSITLVGRGKVKDKLSMRLTQGATEKTVDAEFVDTLESPLASRMYGYVSVGQLESLGAHLEEVSAAYARHFRITGQTCSLLMLETEADYQRFNILPQEDLFVVKTRNASELIEKILEEKQAELVSPKTRLIHWIQKLEKAPGLTFELPTALKLAMDKIEVDAISSSLECKNRQRSDLSDDYLKLLGGERLDYDAVVAEAKKRGRGSSQDAIKVLSSLVERNPGDLTLARDIAFAAMELDEPAQAYGLLRQIAMARPFEPTIYQVLGKCLTQLGKADMAILFYEIAVEAKFQNTQTDFRQIVSVEYMHLLRKIQANEIASKLKDYAALRLASLEKRSEVGEHDIIVTMMWNTDSSDVDLHVLEPNGEDCHYGHRKTKSGGQITSDITDGYGPEMYTLPDAPQGKYQIKAAYFGSNANRTNMRSKVYLTIYRNYGRENETVSFETVELKNTGDLQDAITLGVK